LLVDVRGFEELIFTKNQVFSKLSLKRYCFAQIFLLQKNIPKQNRALALKCAILRASFSSEKL